MTDITTIGDFDATLNGESLSASQDLLIDDILTSGIQAEFIVPGVTTGPERAYVINVSDVTDLGSAEAIQLPLDGGGFAPRADNLMYCNGKWFATHTSSSSRLWISEDGAQTWSHVTNITGKIENIYFINDEYVMYVKLSSAGDNKYVSSNGLTWVGSSMGSTPIITTKYKDNKLVIIWNDVIWKSLDGGVTWTTLTNPTANPNSPDKIYFDWDGDCWFMFGGSSVHKSLDDGLSWGSVAIGSGNNFAKLMPNGQFIVCGTGKILVSNKTTPNTSWTTVNIPNGIWVDVATNVNSIILVGYYLNNTATANTMAMTTNMMGTGEWTITATNTTVKSGIVKTYDSHYIMLAMLADNTMVLRGSDNGTSWFNYMITPDVPLVIDNNITNDLQMNFIETRL